MSRDRPAPDDDALRRLLAEVRHAEPVPDDVAARLDRALLTLETEQGTEQASEQGAPPEPTTGQPAAVVPLRSPKRRQRRRVAVLAAAASVVAALGIAQALRTGSGADSASSTVSAASDAATQNRSGPVDRGEGSGAESEAAQAPGAGERLSPGPRSAPGGRPTPLLLGEDPPAIRSARFARDVRRVRALAGSAQRRQGLSDTTGSDLGSDLGSDEEAGCRVVPLEPGRGVAVLYDGAPAVLLLRRSAGDSQVVDLLQCGTGRVLRSVTLSR